MSRFTFSYEEGGDETTISVSGVNTWKEITRRYYDFLRGCGFVINAQDFADEVLDQVIELRDAEATYVRYDLEEMVNKIEQDGDVPFCSATEDK